MNNVSCIIIIIIQIMNVHVHVFNNHVRYYMYTQSINRLREKDRCSVLLVAVAQCLCTYSSTCQCRHSQYLFSYVNEILKCVKWTNI